MNEDKESKHCYQPLNTGYQPDRGYQPKNQGEKTITPPQGGTGEVNPQKK